MPVRARQRRLDPAAVVRPGRRGAPAGPGIRQPRPGPAIRVAAGFPIRAARPQGLPGRPAPANRAVPDRRAGPAASRAMVRAGPVPAAASRVGAVASRVRVDRAAAAASPVAAAADPGVGPAAVRQANPAVASRAVDLRPVDRPQVHHRAILCRRIGPAHPATHRARASPAKGLDRAAAPAARRPTGVPGPRAAPAIPERRHAAGRWEGRVGEWMAAGPAASACPASTCSASGPDPGRQGCGRRHRTVGPTIPGRVRQCSRLLPGVRHGTVHHSGSPEKVKYQNAEENQTTSSTTVSSPPSTGRVQPGSPCSRRDSILAANTP